MRMSELESELSAKPVLVVRRTNKDDFEFACANAVMLGYSISSTAITFDRDPSEQYYYEAICVRS